MTKLKILLLYANPFTTWIHILHGQLIFDKDVYSINGAEKIGQNFIEKERARPAWFSG